MENIFILKDFPIFMGCVEDDPSNDLKEDFVVDICKTNGIVQTRNLIPLDVLYSENHTSGTIGKIWHDHHESFAQFIKKRKKPENILEIGGLHGILSKYYMKDLNCSWDIIEPTPIPCEGCKANFIKGFFDENFRASKKYDAIVHSHVLEHIYEPSSFVENISSQMSDQNDLFFSIPNIEVMLKNKYSNALNFEHTYLLSEELAIYIFEKNGFDFIESEKFMEDHSIFFWFKKNESKNSTKVSLENHYEKNKKIMTEWKDYYLEDVSKINKKINKSDKVFLFGAHVFSQTLLQFGINQNTIESILDNDTEKQNKRLYGTNLKVKDPSCLKNYTNPKIILRAGVYNNEIEEQILKINKNCQII